MANYDRVNWEDAPSTQTPLNAANLNNMDAGIEGVAEELENVKSSVASFDDRMDLLDARMDTLVAVPPGSTTENTELLDIRLGADGTTYNAAGAAVRGQIEDLNNALDTVEDDIDDILAMIAPVFSPGVYNKGDLVRYENDLYECISKTTSGAAWDSTKWSSIDIASLNRYLHDYIAKPYASGGTVQLYDAGALCFYDHKLYRALEAMSVLPSTPFDNTKWEQVSVGRIFTDLSEDVSDLKADLSQVRVPYGVNLFNKDAITQGQYITSEGTIAESSLYDLTDYIPVNGQFYVTIPHTGNVSTCWYSFYNSSKEFDRRVSYPNTAFTLNHTGYIRINLWSESNTNGHHNIDEIMINNGNTALPYVPYYTAIDRYARENAVLGLGYLADNSDLDNIVGNCVYAISSTYTYAHCPITGGYLETFDISSSAKYQIAVEGDSGRTYLRRKLGGVWQSWVDTWNSMISKGIIPDNTDLNTVTDQGVYLVNSSSTYTHAPFSVGTLIVLKPAPTVCIQLGIQYNSGKVSYRKALNGTFGDWVADQYSGKIAMFGDSITWGQLGGETAGTQTNKGTPYWVSILTHLDATNYGVGGMGWLAESPHESAYDYIQTVDLTNFDFVSFAYGVNDSPKPLGTYLDTVTPGDASETIMGAIYSTMYYMKQNYPTKTFILISPTLGCNWQGSFPEWNWNKVRTGGWTLKEMTEEYKKFADYYHIPFIDLSHSPINSFNVDVLTGGASDIHPTQAGYDILGRFIAGQLSAICG